MTQKLCPVDKKPCIRDECMIWVAGEARCSWAAPEEAPPAVLPPDLAREREKEKRSYSRGRSGSKYSVELFD